MNICLYYHTYNRYDVALGLRRSGLRNSIVVVEEYDLNFACEVLCLPKHADDITRMTNWNRVRTWPLFYPFGISESEKPVTFVVGGTAESILDEVLRVVRELRT